MFLFQLAQLDYFLKYFKLKTISFNNDLQKIEELKQESSQDGDLDRKEDADENKGNFINFFSPSIFIEENEVKSAKNKDTENPKGSNQKTEDGAIIEDKSYSKSMSNQSKNSL